MMKKYNTPEIVTLALDVVDVIETSAPQDVAAKYAQVNFQQASVQTIAESIDEMESTWSW